LTTATGVGPPAGFTLNGRVERSRPYGGSELAILGGKAYLEAKRTITAWPGYAPTPLVALPGIARLAGIGALHYKDEGPRFELGSFKALGGAYAVHRLVHEWKQRYGDDLSRLTVTCATDGNHGRAVAWGAQQFGCRCVVFVHALVSAGRVRAMERYGAEVRRIAGNYDDAVHRAAEEAKPNGWVVVSDTSYAGYTEIPRQVMQGYAVLMDEALQQYDAAAPTHVFVQGGVGGLAAALAAYLWETCGARRPCFIVVEPNKADCLLRSARAGRLQTMTGKLDTIMAGLSCGEPSLLAWEMLAKAADAFMSVRDTDAIACMRLLSAPPAGDTPIVAGESGVAGLAGMLAAVGDPACRSALELGAASRVLVIGTEADTDPELYASLVGVPAAAPAATS
jgi:diaminopropionate ammonia-lyase